MRWRRFDDVERRLYVLLVFALSIISILAETSSASPSMIIRLVYRWVHRNNPPILCMQQTPMRYVISGVVILALKARP